MKTAFIIHGTGGSPEGNWFQSVGKILQDHGYTVIIPRFPTPQGQSLESWTEKFQEYKKYINTQTIFIAHSSGPAFVLSILENIETSVQACYFASGFLWLIDNPDFDTLNQTITHREFDWEKTRKNCPYFYMCHGSNDPYVPLESAQKMSEKLGIEIDIIPNGWHLNQESGYKSFEHLLEKIL